MFSLIYFTFVGWEAQHADAEWWFLGLHAMAMGIAAACVKVYNTEFRKPDKTLKADALKGPA